MTFFLGLVLPCKVGSRFYVGFTLMCKREVAEIRLLKLEVVMRYGISFVGVVKQTGDGS